MKVLVTGASGYIGRHVVSKLCDLGHDVVAASRHQHTSRTNDPRVDYKEVDIFSLTNPFRELGYPDSCIHLAWSNGFTHNSEIHIINIASHYNFIKQMIDGGLRSLSVIGSMHEFGETNGVIEESDSTVPTNEYGLAKMALRKSLLWLTDRSKVDFRWLRLHYIYGDEENGSSVFSKIQAASKLGKPLFAFTDGKDSFDFIHVEEVAKQIAIASLQSKILGEIDCCTGVPRKIGEFALGLIQKNNWKISLEFGAYPRPNTHTREVWGNPERIRKILDAYYAQEEAS